jgi:DNA-binding CsgD family transcriptional regulator
MPEKYVPHEMNQTSSFNAKEVFKLGPARIADLSALIEQCHQIDSREDFRSMVCQALKKVVPHEMFSCGILGTQDLRMMDSINLGFPIGYLGCAIDERAQVVCPVIRKWSKVRNLVFIDRQSDVLQHHDRRWLKIFEKYNIFNLVTHGVMNMNQKQACFFSFGGVPSWTSSETSIFKLLVPHLYYAVTNIEGFGSGGMNTLLTEREKEVIRWIGDGKSNYEIAGILGISAWTVKVHVANLLKKLNASTRGHALSKAMSLGLI